MFYTEKKRNGLLSWQSCRLNLFKTGFWWRRLASITSGRRHYGGNGQRKGEWTGPGSVYEKVRERMRYVITRLVSAFLFCSNILLGTRSSMRPDPIFKASFNQFLKEVLLWSHFISPYFRSKRYKQLSNYYGPNFISWNSRVQTISKPSNKQPTYDIGAKNQPHRETSHLEYHLLWPTLFWSVNTDSLYLRIKLM